MSQPKRMTECEMAQFVCKNTAVSYNRPSKMRHARDFQKIDIQGRAVALLLCEAVASLDLKNRSYRAAITCAMVQPTHSGHEKYYLETRIQKYGILLLCNIARYSA